MRLAPWPDFAGNPIHEGDFIEHPASKERGRIVYLPSEGPEEVDRWRVRYDNDDLFLSRLCLQIGDRGQAVVVTD